jgi:hypothetical protein
VVRRVSSCPSASSHLDLCFAFNVEQKKNRPSNGPDDVIEAKKETTSSPAAMPSSDKSERSVGDGKDAGVDLELRLRDTESSSRRDGVLDSTVGDGHDSVAEGQVTDYKTYKRRWLGLIVLTLLNIIVSWDVGFRLLLPFPSLLLPLILLCSGRTSSLQS